jgi:hypothetical protein
VRLRRLQGTAGGSCGANPLLVPSTPARSSTQSPPRPDTHTQNTLTPTPPNARTPSDKKVWLTIQRPGVFYGQCSELCGANHAFMPIVVEAVTPRQWIQQYLPKWLEA